MYTYEPILANIGNIDQNSHTHLYKPNQRTKQEKLLKHVQIAQAWTTIW